MDVVVVGQHTEVDAALRALTEEKVARVAKFAGDVRRIDVDYGEHSTKRVGDSHTCEILVHVNHHLVKATAAAAEHPVALDLALDKVEHQMRRLHERRVDRRTGSRARQERPNDAAPVETSDEADQPVAKIKQFAVKPMDLEEAALQMELLGHEFFVFRRAENGRVAVLYKRRDTALGVIEVAD
jgi:putative sigma-54 modulation protein